MKDKDSPAPLNEKLPEEEINCERCPYGRASPCIGYCLVMIMQELRVRYGWGK